MLNTFAGRHSWLLREPFGVVLEGFGEHGAAVGELCDAVTGGVLGHRDVEFEAFLGADRGHGSR
ncbi:hypothetical protein ACFVXC_15065 [Streptomyces sp. NPDC058257]|uniref:hypothetical protein n=1 Tax=Streptomyces sp. NPDC058257 TaxID=3346409 RepID=UPI0036EFA7F4